MDLYDRYSLWVIEIYAEYADLIESYGKNEARAEITNIVRDEYDGQLMGQQNRRSYFIVE